MNEENNSLNNYIEQYREWIEKEIPIDDDWIEEINNISFIRDEIHTYFTTAKNDDSDVATIVKELDAKWQQQVSSTKSKNFKYVDKPSGDYPASMWWWHIDRLEEISEAERTTL